MNSPPAPVSRSIWASTVLFSCVVLHIMGVIFVIDCFPILATSTVKIVSDSDISTDRLPKNPLPLSLLGLSYFFLWRLSFFSSFLCFNDFLVHLLLDSVVEFLYFFVVFFLAFHGIDGSRRRVFDFGSSYLIGFPVFYPELTGFFFDGDLSARPVDDWLVFLEPW